MILVGADAQGVITNIFEAGDPAWLAAVAEENGCVNWAFSGRRPDAEAEMLDPTGALVPRPPDTAAALERERARMRPYRRAVRAAMLRLPGPQGFATMLDFVDAMVADPGFPREAAEAWTSVIQFERLNPDVALWSPVVGLGDPGTLDTFFRLALAIEAGEDTAALQADLLAALDA